MKKYDKLIIFFAILLLISSNILSFITGKKITDSKRIDFSNIEIKHKVTKYDVIKLDTEIAEYIIALSNEFNLNSDLPIAILMQENPQYKTDAISKRNLNGSIDIGLFQLNDRYLYTDFKKYWDDNIDKLDPFNWKINTYIAINHINYLKKKLKTDDDTIMAYNCGTKNVIRKTIPDTTKDYLRNVKYNLELLKRIDEELKNQ